MERAPKQANLAFGGVFSFASRLYAKARSTKRFDLRCGVAQVSLGVTRI